MLFYGQAHRQVRCPVRARRGRLASAVEASRLAEAVAASPAPLVQGVTVSQAQWDLVVPHPSQVSHISRCPSTMPLPPPCPSKPHP